MPSCIGQECVQAPAAPRRGPPMSNKFRGALGPPHVKQISGGAGAPPCQTKCGGAQKALQRGPKIMAARFGGQIEFARFFFCKIAPGTSGLFSVFFLQTPGATCDFFFANPGGYFQFFFANPGGYFRLFFCKPRGLFSVSFSFSNENSLINQIHA